MNIWEIILGLGAVGSLAMWLRDLFAKHRPLRELIYPLLTIVLSVSSVLLYSQNVRLLDPVEQARLLVKSWPATTYDGRFHEAQAQGVVLAGLRYLEIYKSVHPDTYERHRQAYERTDFSNSLQATRAADAMIAAIRSYAGDSVRLD